MAEIDRLEVKIEAQAKSAYQELDILAAKLERVSSSLKKLDTRGLSGFASSINKLTRSVQGMNGVDSGEFSRLAGNMKKLNNIDTSSLEQIASSMSAFGNALSAATIDSSYVAQIEKLGKSISKLGSKSTLKAIDNMPKLAAQMNSMMGTLSKAPAVSDNLIQMTNAMAKLASQSSKAGTALNATGKSNTSISKLFSSITSSASSATKSTKDLSYALGNFYAGYITIIRGIKSLWNSVESSMDYVETFNYWNVALDKIGKEFGNQYEKYGYDSADSYAASFRERLEEITKKMTGYEIDVSGELNLTDTVGLGLDPEQIMNYQARIGAVTNSVGLMGEVSTNAAKALSMLAADMSSFTNRDLSQVMTNFQSGLIGQSRALHQYGIDITNATLQTYAYDMGLSKAIATMTQAEKMQLRLVAILDQSRVAWGDQANTINSISNQYRILKQQVSNLTRTIGNLLMPIIKSVLPVVNGLVISITRLFTALGFKVWGQDWLKDLQGGISGGYGGDESFDDVIDGADDAADSIGAADKAAKSLKGTLAEFDKLNVITSPSSDSSDSSSSGSGSGGSIDLSDAIAGALEDYQSMWDKAFESSGNKAQQYADAICDMFNKMWEAIEPFRESLNRLWNEGLLMLAGYSFEALKDFYNEFLKPLGEWALGTPEEGLTRLVDVINNSLLAVDWLWITENLKNFWIAIEPYSEQFGEGLIDFFEDVSELAVDAINKLFGQGGALEKMTEWLNNGDFEKARSWGYALGVLATGFLALKGVTAVLSGIAGIGTAFSTLSKGLAGVFGAEGIFATIGKVVSGLFAEGGLFGSGGVIATAGLPIIALAAALATLATGLAYVFKTNEDVRNSFDQAVTTIKDNMQPAFDFLSETVLPNLESAWDELLKMLQPLGDFLEETFTSIWQDMINPALTYIGEEVLPKLTETFENLWNNVLVPLGEVVGDVLGPAFQVLSDILSLLWENIIKPLAEFIGTQLAGAFEVMTTLLNEVVIPHINKVIAVFQFLWHNVLEPVIGFFGDIWGPVFESICKSIGEVIDRLKETFSGLVDFITGIFSGDWEKAWNGVKEIFSGIWNTLSSALATPLNAVLSLFEGLANKIIDAWNWIKSGIGSLSFDMPDWLPQWLGGGQHFGMSFTMSEHINIPRFESGGFPNTGELFLARENGIAEMVGSMGRRTAVANNNQITSGISDSVYPAVYNAVRDAFDSNSNGQSGDMVVQINGKEVFRAVRKEAQNHFNMNGCSPFPV